MSGQINLGTTPGNLIYRLTKRDDVKNIVEIGTWNGEGSTVCVLQGLMECKDKKNFISIELYPDMYEVAKGFLSPYEQYVKLLNGRIIEHQDAFWFNHKTLDLIYDSHARMYYHQDLNYLKHIPNVINELPETIDLLILDGGEYTTYPEWIKLKDRTRIVVLDDTAILKCKRIRQEIMESKQYHRLYDNVRQRNGFAVFEKINTH